MGKNEDRRVQQTRQRLREAFLRALQTTPIHSVSIRELCADAGVNRTTFYNHYGSQYDLLADISRRFLDSIAERLGSTEDESRESVCLRVATVLEFIAENRELSVLLINNSVDPTFAERIFSLPKIGSLLEAALSDCPDGEARAATVAFVIHGSYRLLQDWINREDRPSPQAQARLMLELAHRAAYRREPGAESG